MKSRVDNLVSPTCSFFYIRSCTFNLEGKVFRVSQIHCHRHKIFAIPSGSYRSDWPHASPPRCCQFTVHFTLYRLGCFLLPTRFIRSVKHRHYISGGIKLIVTVVCVPLNVRVKVVAIDMHLLLENIVSTY